MQACTEAFLIPCPTMNKYVSVIIPAYNAASLIGRCIDSVLSQFGVDDVAVIVVDDGSTDETSGLVRGIDDPRITILRQENQGPAAARNRGLEEAAGDYVAFLDADDYWKPEFLSETVGFLQTNPEAIAVSVGQVHKFPGKPDTVVPQFLQGNVCLREPRILDSFFAFWAEHNHVCTGSVLMRADVVRQTRGQREELRVCEDIEFWAYLATFGPWGFIPEVFFVSNGERAVRKQGWLNKNKRRWASATGVEDWQKRIVQRISPQDLDYFKAGRARVARNLAHAMVLSYRDVAARQACAWLDGYRTDRLGSLLARASQSLVTWKFLCGILRSREWWRDKCLRTDRRADRW